jgi:hypothetical protein
MNFITFVFKGLIMHYAIGTYKEVKVQLHEFTTSVPDENEW